MSEKWPEVTIGEICNIQADRREPQHLPADTRYLGLEHIKSEHFRILGFGPIEEISSSVSPFQKTDVLFGRLRPYLRKVVLADTDGVCTPEILVLRPNPSLVLPLFLHSVVSSEPVIERCIAMSAGTRMPRTKANDLAEIPVLLPPLDVQNRVVDLIESVDSYIDALRVQADAARTARTSLLHELLNAGGDGWVETTLGEAAEVVSGGTPKTSEDSYWGGGIVWVTPSEVVAAEGCVINDSERTLTPEGLAKSSAKMLPPGAVLLTSRATIGATAMAGVSLCTNQGFASLVAGMEAVPEFLMYWCQANTVEFTSRSGGNTFKEISRKKVAAIPMLLPPMDEQRRICDLVASVDGTAHTADLAIANAEALRSALLSALLSGNHEIPESYDELLEAS